jgi:hypothetical protein
MKFYVFDYMSTAKSQFAEFELAGKATRIEPPHCEDCGARLGPLLRAPPHRYRIKRGELGDLITDGMVFAVSERFKKSYATSSSCGLAFCPEPVQLLGTDLIYFMATPKHTRVLLDEEASGLVAWKVAGCEKCRVMSVTKFDRIRVKEGTWQGEDVFLIASITQTMATADFVFFVESHGFTNCRFVDPERCQVDFGTSVGTPK